MMAFTHIAFGAASALLAAEWLDAPAPQAVLMLAGGVLGSMLPDIDHPGSAFGRRVLPISMVLADLFGHRGITHSLLAVVGMSALAWYSLHHLDWHPGYSVPFVVGIAVGYPIPQTKKIAGKCCQPLGRSTILWGAGREFPFEGEDFAYQIFRKRNCCQGAVGIGK